MRADRLDRIEQYVLERGNASIPEIAETFDISINTVRRDLAELLRRGNIRKVYGGVSTASAGFSPMSVREAANEPEKKTIGRLAAEMVEDGNTIFLDAGSTVPHLIGYLKDRSNVTIITHNLKAIEEASKYENLRIIAIGGEYNYHTQSFVGIAASEIEQLHYRIDKVFLATTAVSAKFGLSNTTFLEAEIKRKLVSAGGEVILLADHTKFGQNAVISFCALDQLAAVVTDRKPDEDFSAAMDAAGAKLVYPGV